MRPAVYAKRSNEVTIWIINVLLNNTFSPLLYIVLYFNELNRKFTVNKSYEAAGYCHLHLSNFKHNGSHTYHLLSYWITAFYKHVGSNINFSEFFFFRRFSFSNFSRDTAYPDMSIVIYLSPFMHILVQSFNYRHDPFLQILPSLLSSPNHSTLYSMMR